MRIIQEYAMLSVARSKTLYYATKSPHPHRLSGILIAVSAIVIVITEVAPPSRGTVKAAPPLVNVPGVKALLLGQQRG